MPAPKLDLETIYGRLQYARDRSGYKQEEFAQLVGFSATGWGKIERGQRGLLCEYLERANKILKLDIGFYFGEIPYENAIGSNNFNYQTLIEKINSLESKVKPPEDIDQLAYKVTIDPDLRRIVESVAWKDGILKKPRATPGGPARHNAHRDD